MCALFPVPALTGASSLRLQRRTRTATEKHAATRRFRSWAAWPGGSAEVSVDPAMMARRFLDRIDPLAGGSPFGGRSGAR
jgi:hypothetical protein